MDKAEGVRGHAFNTSENHPLAHGINKHNKYPLIDLAPEPSLASWDADSDMDQDFDGYDSLPAAPQEQQYQSEHNHTFRSICKKCGDHRHHTNDCTTADTAKKPCKEPVDSITSEIAREGMTYVISLRTKRTAYECSFCGGGGEPLGPCSSNETARMQHTKLLRYETDEQYREFLVLRMLKRQRKKKLKKMNHKRTEVGKALLVETPEGAAAAIVDEYGLVEMKKLEQSVISTE